MRNLEVFRVIPAARPVGVPQPEHFATDMAPVRLRRGDRDTGNRLVEVN